MHNEERSGCLMNCFVQLKIITEKMEVQKLCASWMPEFLSEKHKTQWMGSALDLLTCYKKDGDTIYVSIGMGDETWVAYDPPETKQQSIEWRHSSSPAKVKPKQILISRSTRHT